MQSFKLEPRERAPDPQAKYAILLIGAMCAVDAIRLRHFIWAGIIFTGLFAKGIHLALGTEKYSPVINTCYVVGLIAACAFELLKIIGQF